MHSSRLFAFQLAIHISENLEAWSVTCSDAANERSIFIQRRCINSEKRFFTDKLDSFGIQYRDHQKLSNNLAVFDFESICIPEEKFKNSETTTWIGERVPISVSISSNLIAKPIFLCNSNPREMVESFIDAVESLATQSKAQMKLKFLEIETAIKSKLSRILQALSERRLIYGIMRICAHFKTFYARTTTKRLSQPSKQCKNCCFFIKWKELTCWSWVVHFRIWQLFVSTNLPVPISIHLLKSIKTCWKRFEKIWLVVLLSSSHVKLMSMKLPSEIQELPANLLLILMQISFFPILCVSPCQQDCKCVGNMTQNVIGVNLNKTNPETLRTWFCHISKDKNLTVKLMVYTPQQLRKTLIFFKVDGFWARCNTVFEGMGCFYHYCHRREARPSLIEKDIKRGNRKREVDQIRKHYIKDIMLLKSGNVIGGIFIKRQRVLKNIWETNFFTNVYGEKKDCWNEKELVNCLVMFSMTLKYQRSSRSILLFLHRFSKIKT